MSLPAVIRKARKLTSYWSLTWLNASIWTISLRGCHPGQLHH